MFDNNVFRHGATHYVLTDNGKEFVNKVNFFSWYVFLNASPTNLECRRTILKFETVQSDCSVFKSNSLVFIECVVIVVGPSTATTLRD